MLGVVEPVGAQQALAFLTVPMPFSRLTAVHGLQGQDTACRVTDSEVPGAPEPGTHSLTFLTKHELKGADVAPLPPAQMALVRPTTPPGGLPALHPPSKVNVPFHITLLVPFQPKHQ